MSNDSQGSVNPSRHQEPAIERHHGNAAERTWRDLKRHNLAHRTFKDAADLTTAIHAAVKQLNKESMNPHPCDELIRLLRPSGRESAWWRRPGDKARVAVA